MKKLLLIVLFFLMSCNTTSTIKSFKFSDDMTFDEFKVKVEEYAKENPYPKIDD